MPSGDETSELTTLLRRLVDARVDFVLVGGLAAVAQGAPVTTFDVDIVPRREPDNVDRLIDVLRTLRARYRGRPGGPPLEPQRDALLGTGHHLLMTDLGPLDVLGAIDEGRDYDDLRRDSVTVDVGDHSVHVLSIEAIVRAKRASSHPKDRYVLPVLEAVLRGRDED